MSQNFPFIILLIKVMIFAFHKVRFRSESLYYTSTYVLLIHALTAALQSTKYLCCSEGGNIYPTLLAEISAILK